jgi:outer membrane receptor protein involved in Fe transport
VTVWSSLGRNALAAALIYSAASAAQRKSDAGAAQAARGPAEGTVQQPVQQASGSIRGNVLDKDFDRRPLAGAEVQLLETGARTLSGDQGNFVFAEVPPGKYTLVFSKDGYVRQVRADVLVSSGKLTDVEVALAGDYTDMEEFIVQDALQLGGSSETSLLALRYESPALMDSIGADLMSRAGASDAASALRLVSGTTVQDGKFAVVRGLPDRYVSSQLNGVRLPSADDDKRAVDLDQFPSTVIESVRVSKTFTPDQQGDASGGAVDVRTRGVPDGPLLAFGSQISANSRRAGSGEFLSYDGGGFDFWGHGSGRDIQFQDLGQSWDGAAGTSTEDPPVDSKWSLAIGDRFEAGDGIRIGGLASFFYERDSSFHDDERDDSWWVDVPGQGMVPQTNQGTPSQGDFKTALFDITEGVQSVQWGGLAAIGLETERNAIGLSYLSTHTAEDKATLAEDTRGKEYFFPGYDPGDPQGPGNTPSELNAAPYLRTETLEYTEQDTGSLQLDGRHTLPFRGFSAFGGSLTFLEPRIDWTLSNSNADLDQPDKRQFGELWHPASFNPGAPPFIPPFTTQEVHLPYFPAANFNLGNFQRIWTSIEETSDQISANLELPFEQWSGDQGFLKLGLFDDDVERGFDQDTFSNIGDQGSSFPGPWEEHWSEHFPLENHPILASDQDVDYHGEQRVSAFYSMADVPLSKRWSVTGGARWESTEIDVILDPEAGAYWYPPGSLTPVELDPGDADVDFEQRDVLPSIGVKYEPFERWVVRAAYSETIARQTFKELTPIIQQEFLGGPVFIGNPALEMSSARNYDLRVDYTPRAGSFLSASLFHKRLEDPIEYVQSFGDFSYTTPVNYPEGEMTGVELEVRQELGGWVDSLEGLWVGANATFLDAEVTLTDAERAIFDLPSIAAPMSKRDMTLAPEHLYNLYLTYDWPSRGTQLGVFYTVQGDTLVAGAGTADNNFVPSVYAKEYGTLNLSLSQRLGEHWLLQFQAKNLTDPEIEEVYRSEFIGSDKTHTSYHKGIEYSLTLGFRL